MSIREGFTRLVSRAMAAGGLLLGCTPAAPPQPSGETQRDAKVELQVLLAEHDVLLGRITAAAPDARTRCELGAGDCVVLIAERRAELSERHRLRPCGGDETGDGCLLEQLAQSHKEQEASAYVAFKNWCFGELLKCVEGTVAADGQQKALGRGEARRRKIETSAPVVEQWRAVEVARARIDYLRSTLPPQAGEVCTLPAVTRCREEVQQKLSALDEELGGDDYNEGRAARRFAAIKREEAVCLRPEFYCLTNALTRYGATGSSRKVLESNLAALDKRQKLAFTADESAQGDCLAGQEQAHEPAIEAAFQAYAGEPTSPRRATLEKAYLALHESQIACLVGRAAGATAAPTAPGTEVIELD